MTPAQQISLYYRDQHSDKEYHVQLIDLGDRSCLVQFQYGRRGTSLTAGTKTSAPVGRLKAQAIYDKLVKEKTAKGYTPGESGVRYQATPQANRVTGLRPQLQNAITDSEVAIYLDSPTFMMQEKKDGRRVMVRKHDGQVIGSKKLGLEIALPTPIVEGILALPSDRLELDGELVGDTYHIFDVLHNGDQSFLTEPYQRRYAHLKQLPLTSPLDLITGVMLPNDKAAAFARLKAAGVEGVVFKDVWSRYMPGRPARGGGQLKYKFVSSVSCLVSAHNTRRSVHLALIDETQRVVSIGNVTIPANQAVPALQSVIEVRYLYAMPDSHQLIQPVYLGLRDDILAHDCRLSQLHYKASTDEDDAD